MVGCGKGEKHQGGNNVCCGRVIFVQSLLMLISYKKAYESMKACPLTFSHPSEAQQLHGLGPKICDRLAEELKKHCAANGLPMPKKCKPQELLTVSVC